MKDKKVLKRFRTAVFERLSRKEKNLLWQRIEVSAGNPAVKRIALSRILFRVAASIIVLIALGYWVKETIGKQNIAQNEQVIVETLTKERICLMLPDSSLVWLNAGSRIEYPEKFDAKERRVTLSGEAYFNVRPEKTRKFIVRSENITVNVLGTQFTVVDYSKEKITEVVLVSGKVKVNGLNDGDQEFHLLPGERFVFDKTTNRKNIEKTDVSLYTNWLGDRINFNNAELKYIVQNLERWYGISFICPENVGTSHHLTFTLRNENLEQTLTMMRDIAPIQFKETTNGIEVIEK